jgi:hypothetical protein
MTSGGHQLLLLALLFLAVSIAAFAQPVLNSTVESVGAVQAPKLDNKFKSGNSGYD